jgi:hypothetical protein
MQTTNQSSQQELSCTNPPPLLTMVNQNLNNPYIGVPLYPHLISRTSTPNNVYLSTLLGTIDIIAIQEHWLFKFEKSKLHEFAENYKFSCFIKSVDENYPISVK